VIETQSKSLNLTSWKCVRLYRYIETKKAFWIVMSLQWRD